MLVREPGGRPTKEIIITTGLNVYPSGVESVLREQPSVVDLTVMGLPGDDGGELVVAAAVLLHEAPSTSTVSARTPIAGNHIARAAHHGIGVNNFDPEAPMTGTVIRGNVVSKAAIDGIDGIAVATAADAPGIVTDALVEDNIAIGAADDGIDVDSAATTLTRVPRCANWDRGVEALAGVTDGGRNKARGDGNPAQCTNITRTSSTFACG